MKNLFKVICLVMSIMFVLASCNSKEEVKGQEVIMDVNMERGVDVLGQVSITDLNTVHRYFKYLNTVESSVNAFWKLGQWGTKFSLRDGEELQNKDNYILKDNTKEFIVNPKTGQYSLNCNTADEYPTPRVFGQEWLHFISIQNIVEVARVGEMKKIYAELDFEITDCQNLMGNDFNEGLHTALFQWVFIARNDNLESSDYGQYIWVNIPYYDYRYAEFKEDAFLDYGKEDKSDTFIYTASSENYLGKKQVKIGERRKITIDMVEYIELALNKIKTLPANLDSKKPILTNTTLDDLRIEQFYIGWETPGTFISNATIYKNSLRYERKD